MAKISSRIEKGKKSSFLQLKNLTKTYETRTGSVSALDDVSFDVSEMQFISILGPSGCGKSTLLFLISGLTPPTKGEIILKGTHIKGPPGGIGMVFQSSILFPWRNVWGNIMYSAQLCKIPAAKAEKKASELLRLTGLAGFEEKYPHELSGGMQQRVSICRALIVEPPLLLMDEPFGALDALTRDKLNLEIQDIWANIKTTILFVTHNIQEAVTLGDRVIVLSPRPARIVEDLKIELPRPRTLKGRATKKFQNYCTHLYKSIGLT